MDNLPTKESVSVLTQTILPIVLHGTNPRTLMGEYNWKKVKKQVQSQANHHCMCCGRYVSHTPGDWIESHEMYNIDLNKHEFSLSGYVGLCHECHNFIHEARLNCLLVEGKISNDEFNQIMKHGNDLLNKFGLEKKNLPSNEISNPNWYLLYNGNKYGKKENVYDLMNKSKN